MKVWINKTSYPYSGGLAIVAANSAEEAHGILVKEICHHDFYASDTWEEAKLLSANTDAPCLIAEDCHEG